MQGIAARTSPLDASPKGSCSNSDFLEDGIWKPRNLLADAQSKASRTLLLWQRDWSGTGPGSGSVHQSMINLALPLTTVFSGMDAWKEHVLFWGQELGFTCSHFSQKSQAVWKCRRIQGRLGLSGRLNPDTSCHTDPMTSKLASGCRVQRSLWSCSRSTTTKQHFSNFSFYPSSLAHKLPYFWSVRYFQHPRVLGKNNSNTTL